MGVYNNVGSRMNTDESDTFRLTLIAIVQIILYSIAIAGVAAFCWALSKLS